MQQLDSFLKNKKHATFYNKQTNNILFGYSFCYELLFRLGVNPLKKKQKQQQKQKTKTKTFFFNVVFVFLAVRHFGRTFVRCQWI